MSINTCLSEFVLRTSPFANPPQYRTLMTDTDEEPQLGRGLRKKKLTDKGTRYWDGRDNASDNRDSQVRSQTIKKKRAAQILSSSPAKSIGSLGEDQAATASQATDPKPDKGKGKATVANQMRRLLTPIDEDSELPEPLQPGPKPGPDLDDLFLELEIDEWKRRCLLYYLRHRDNRIINPHTDYPDLKKILGDDQLWHSDDDQLENLAHRPSQTNNDIGQFDEEPPARKLVSVKPINATDTQSENTSNKRKTVGEFNDSGEHDHPTSTQAQSVKRQKSGLVGQKSAPSSSAMVGGPPLERLRSVLGLTLAQSQPPPLPPSQTRASGAHPASNQLRTSISSSNHPKSSQIPPGTSSSFPARREAAGLSSGPSDPPPVPSSSRSGPPRAPSASRYATGPSRRDQEYYERPTTSNVSRPVPAPPVAKNSAQGTGARPNRGQDPSVPPPAPRQSSRRDPSAAPPVHPSNQLAKSDRSGGNVGVPRNQRGEHGARNSTDRARSVSNSTTSGQSGTGGRLNRQGRSENSTREGGDNHQARQEVDERQDNQREHVDTDDEGPPPAVRQKPGGRARLRDFEGVQKSILTWAGRAYIVIMVMDGMYETEEDVLNQRRLKAWKIGCIKYEVNLKNSPLCASHIQNMNDRMIAWRGKARDLVRGDVEKAFFEKGMLPNAIKTRVEELKAGGLHTKPDSRRGTGYFQHEILQTCFVKMFFKTFRKKHKKDLGVEFPNLFKKVTVELVCFICAIIHAIVDEFETGTQESDSLDFESQRKAYLTHSGSHSRWVNRNKPRWEAIQEQMSVRAFAQIGLSYSVVTDEIERNIIPEEDIMSDNPDEGELAAWREERSKLDPQDRYVPDAWGANDALGGVEHDQPHGEQDANQGRQPVNEEGEMDLDETAYDGANIDPPRHGDDLPKNHDSQARGSRDDYRNQKYGPPGPIYRDDRHKDYAHLRESSYTHHDGRSNGNHQTHPRYYPDDPHPYHYNRRASPDDPYHHRGYYRAYYEEQQGSQDGPRFYRNNQEYAGDRASYPDQARNEHAQYRYNIPGLHYRDFGGPNDEHRYREPLNVQQEQYPDDFGDDHPVDE